MNSDEEKAVFEKYGWVYNYVERRWEAPDGAFLLLDDIASITTESREQAEQELVSIIKRHGNAKAN